MPNFFEKKTLQDILNIYDEKKTFFSRVIPHRTIQLLKQLSQSKEKINESDVFVLLSQHPWNQEKKTATDICVATILTKIFNPDFSVDMLNFPSFLLATLKRMAIYKLLYNLEAAKTNFTTITQGGGQYAENIADALEMLSRTGLLTGGDAQTNFMAITQGGGRFAGRIALALYILSLRDLLTGDDAQANRDAITQGGGQYAKNIADALEMLSRAGLLRGDDAQANRDAITQGGGQYAKNIADALEMLSRAGLLTGDDAQANRDAITQGGGQYAKNIARALDILNQRDLLTGDDAQANRDAITQGGGQYAKNIAEALEILSRKGLLTGDDAQANRDAITQGGGQYAKNIADALEILSRTGLLTSGDAQTNFIAITQGGGQYAENIVQALHILSWTGLLKSGDAQSNFMAITQGGRQYAKNIAEALDILNQRGLLSGGDAQSNFMAITQGGGQYAKNIAQALDIFNQKGLLTGDDAQANREAITQGGGQYAKNIAEALEILSRKGLLTGDDAQANRDAITQGGGQYAENIREALDILNLGGLLSGGNAQKNIALLFSYVNSACEWHHGIKFLTQTMLSIQDLNQEYYELLMLEESISLTQEQSETFGQWFSFPEFYIPENVDIDFSCLFKEIKDILHFCEYVTTYYAVHIAEVLIELCRAGLLTGDNAQVYRQAIIQSGGRKYAQEITEALEALESAGLLKGDHAQNNVVLLFSYVVDAHEWHHGIKFLMQTMLSIQDLNQEHYELLMLEESISLTQDQSETFGQWFSFPEFDIPENVDIDFRCLFKDILHFCEYVATYLEEENMSLGSLAAILNHVETHVSTANLLFKELYKECLEEDVATKKQAMLVIIEMLTKNEDPDATIKSSIYQKITEIYSTSDGFAQTDMTTETEQPNTFLPRNEGTVILLLMIISNSYESFCMAWNILCQHNEKPKNLTTLSSSDTVRLFGKPSITCVEDHFGLCCKKSMIR